MLKKARTLILVAMCSGMLFQGTGCDAFLAPILASVISSVVSGAIGGILLGI